jgi:hypothetical protein
MQTIPKTKPSALTPFLIYELNFSLLYICKRIALNLYKSVRCKQSSLFSPYHSILLQILIGSVSIFWLQELSKNTSIAVDKLPSGSLNSIFPWEEPFLETTSLSRELWELVKRFMYSWCFFICTGQKSAGWAVGKDRWTGNGGEWDLQARWIWRGQAGKASVSHHLQTFNSQNMDDLQKMLVPLSAVSTDIWPRSWRNRKRRLSSSWSIISPSYCLVPARWTNTTVTMYVSCNCTWLYTNFLCKQDFCFPSPLPILWKFILRSVLTHNHTGKGILGNLSPV